MERRTRRDRRRTLAWRLRPFRRALASVAAVLALLGFLAGWQAVKSRRQAATAQPPGIVTQMPRPAPPAASALAIASGRPPALPQVVYGPSAEAPRPAVPVAGRFAVRAAVLDGDTLAVGSDRLRIFGIDAPESDQPCRRHGSAYACGAVARDAMVAIIGGGSLACEALDTDRYGRRVVRCVNDRGADIGSELVRQGWAIAFRRFSLAYVDQEAEARATRRGMWEGNFDDPAAWRARMR